MKWGLIAYGRIAKKFIASLQTVSKASLTGVASLTKYSDIKQDLPDVLAYDSYDNLLANPEIDIVYISTTHNYHKENVLKALHAGKHVLCEKPMGIHHHEVKEMVALAREKNLFLMEAIWSRFLPAYSAMKKHVNNGDLGEVKLIQADFAFDGTDLDSDSRLKNPAYAAGAIWDVGLYPISLAIDIFDEMPDEILCRGFVNELGVDERSTILLTYKGSRQAILHCGIDLSSIHDGKIIGTKQWIHLPQFWRGQNLSIGTWQKSEQFDFPINMDTSFSFEIMACYEAIEQGWIEHPRVSHRHSLMIADVMDNCLRQLRSSD